ncbi:MAG: DNA mismatch repair endonuclease MutL [Bacilli bacterium]|nr:DNA mismatch repair endonuclease MutL [Bacilli bacterium]
MSKIKVMSEQLANKIAAGEVVEKCSSIVKELVENSIDAGAKHIDILLEEGGKKKIEVIDDGSGMDREDAKLAFQRHATSKIYKDDDLFFIDTLGFRGEALPSIASVAKVDLKTGNGEVGTHLLVEGGVFQIEETCEALKGTRFSITHLFYNTPARLKYLKSEQSELSSCVSFVERLALSKPDISFHLYHENHPMVKTSGSGNLLKTIHEIYGTQVSSKMLEFSSSSDDFDIYGYACKPEVLKSNKNQIITMVNDRIVKNYEITRAITDAYYNYKPDGKYPIVILKINTDPTLMDVNIHPTKQDIKLSKMDRLYALILNTLKDTLHQSLLIPDASLRLSSNSDVKQSIIEDKIAEEEESIVSSFSSVQEEFDFHAEEKVELPFEEEVEINPEIKRLHLTPLCQIHRTFIVAEDESGMYLLDQHAVAERINYEKVKKAIAEKQIFQTRMLIPITIEFSSSEFLTLKDHFGYLESLGFELEEFGVNTVIIKAHPTWIATGYEEETIRKMMDMIVHDESRFDQLKFQEHFIQTTACKMSIKANQDLSMEAMKELLDELFLCDNPYNCAHGRPSIMKFSNYDLDRMFKRVMN